MNIFLKWFVFSFISTMVSLLSLLWTQYSYERMSLEGNTPENIERSIIENPPSPIPEKENLPAMVDADDPAFIIIQEAQCIACHGAELEGAAAPSLRGAGDRYSEEGLYEIIMYGNGGAMPAFEEILTPDEIEKLASWLEKQKTVG